MADELISTAPETTTQNNEVAAPEMDLAAHMAIALGNGMPPQASTEQAANVNEPAAATAEPVNQDVAPSDPFGIFKEKFGYETPDAAIREIEELRAFKAQPRPEEFIVPDNESAAILKALKAGKKEDVWRVLDHDMRIERLLSSEVNKDSAADIVKMGMALKYKDLTPEEINYKFNKQFAIPAQPQRSYEEDDDSYNQRVADWQSVVADKQMELMIEAKLAKPELQNAKGKIELPDIETETSIDEGYVQYQKMLEESTRADVETRAAYQKLTPKAIETKLNFKDEANKISFEFQYEPDAEGFKKAVEIASNSDLFWQTFTNPDGTPNREKFLEAIYFANNKEKYLLAALNQSKNATIKASLPDNSQGGLTRQVAQSQEPNDLDKMMRASLAGYGGF